MSSNNTPIENKLHTSNVRYSKGSPVFGVESFTCAACPPLFALTGVVITGCVFGLVVSIGTVVCVPGGVVFPVDVCVLPVPPPEELLPPLDPPEEELPPLSEPPPFPGSVVPPFSEDELLIVPE